MQLIQRVVKNGPSCQVLLWLWPRMRRLRPDLRTSFRMRVLSIVMRWERAFHCIKTKMKRTIAHPLFRFLWEFRRHFYLVDLRVRIRLSVCRSCMAMWWFGEGLRDCDITE